MLEDWLIILVCIQLKLSERRASSQGPGDDARSCHCCLNRSATVRQKLQQAGMVLFTQACSFVATLLTKKKSHGHCTCTRRSWISLRYSYTCTRTRIWYVVVSDHAHFAASLLYLTRPLKECVRAIAAKMGLPV